MRAKPFKAAQVYLRNVDKRMLYMVYTNAGKFRAVALLPGNYEISVQARGLESDVQKLVIKAGDRPTVKLSMRDAVEPRPFPERRADAVAEYHPSELRRSLSARSREAGHGGSVHDLSRREFLSDEAQECSRLAGRPRFDDGQEPPGSGQGQLVRRHPGSAGHEFPLRLSGPERRARVLDQELRGGQQAQSRPVGQRGTAATRPSSRKPSSSNTT